jgi:hypothetical protein
MFGAIEVPKADRERWYGLNDKLLELQESTEDAYREGRRAMSQTNISTEDLRTIISSQSVVKLLPFLTGLLSSADVQPEMVAQMLRGVNDIVDVPHKCAPVASTMKDFLVQVDTYLTRPDAGQTISEPFLSLTKTLVDDPQQTCIGYANSHRYIRGQVLQNIRQAISQKDTRAVTDNLVNFWKNDNEFADDDTIRLAYQSWRELSERISENPSYPVPLGLTQATKAFTRILETNTTLLSDRQAIASFWVQVKNIHFENAPVPVQLVTYSWTGGWVSVPVSYFQPSLR